MKRGVGQRYNPLMPLLNRFLRDLDRLDLRAAVSGRPVVVGVSGGADSLCLLHLLCRAADTLTITLFVATLDHGLRGQIGAEDAAFVEQIAQAWGLPVRRERQDVIALAREHGLGIEDAARRARYTFLAQVAQDTGAAVIAVAHNADDQAETVLMRVIRGSGLAGLRGMLPLSPLSADHLLPGVPPVEGLLLARPLLDVPRADIDAYCAAHDLHPRQDATNEARTYLRNRVRHDLLPQIVALNPGVRAALGRMARLLAADYAQLQAAVAMAFDALLLEQTPGGLRLDRERFCTLSLSLRRGVIREAARRLRPDLREVSFATVEQAVQVATSGKAGGAAVLPGGMTLRVEGGALVLARPDAVLPVPNLPRLPIGAELAVSVPGVVSPADSNWVFCTRWLAPGENPADFYGRFLTAVLAVPEGASLALRTRRRGDRFAPQGMGGHTQKLSDLLINTRVPAAERDTLPLLTVNGAIGWVAWRAGRVAEPFVVNPTSRWILLASWEYDPIV